MICFRKLALFIIALSLFFIAKSQTSRIDRPDRIHDIDSLVEVAASGKLNAWDRCDLLIEISRIYRTMEDTAKCKAYVDETLHLAQKNNLLDMEAAAYTTLGGYYIFLGIEYMAYVNFKKAEQLFQKTDNKKWLAIVYQSLMVLFNKIEDYESTLYFSEKVLEMAIERKDTITEILASFFLGRARFIDKEGEEALNFFNDLLQKSLHIKHPYNVVIGEYCIDICIKMNDPQKAMQYVQQQLEFFESTKFPYRSSTYGHLSEVYALLQKSDTAEFYLSKMLETPFITPGDRMKQNKIQSLIHANSNDDKSALEKYKNYHHLSDSIDNAGKTTEIARIKNWLELEQKDNENEILQLEKQKRQNLIFILAGAVVLIFVLLAISVILYRKTADRNSELKKLHAVKDKLFSVIAHNLRSPMGALRSVLKLSDKNVVDDETKEYMFQDISNSLDETFGLLENLLLWAKSQMQGIVPNPANFYIDKTSHAIINSIKHIAENKKIVIKNHVEKHQVYADRNMITIVMRNLILNAIKYCSAVSEVTLASELSGNMMIISVRNNGLGMPQNVQDKLFNVAETQNSNENGTGLGLALCADFIKANGGKIWFTSTAGKGSTFYFSLPHLR